MLSKLLSVCRQDMVQKLPSIARTTWSGDPPSRTCLGELPSRHFRVATLWGVWHQLMLAAQPGMALSFSLRNLSQHMLEYAERCITLRSAPCLNRKCRRLLNSAFMADDETIAQIRVNQEEDLSAMILGTSSEWPTMRFKKPEGDRALGGLPIFLRFV